MVGKYEAAMLSRALFTDSLREHREYLLRALGGLVSVSDRMNSSNKMPSGKLL